MHKNNTSYISVNDINNIDFSETEKKNLFRGKVLKKKTNMLYNVAAILYIII